MDRANKYHVGELFREARKEQNLTMEYVASRLGKKSIQFISRIETGKRLPSPATAVKIGKVLNLDENLLFETLAVAHRQLLSKKIRGY